MNSPTPATPNDGLALQISNSLSRYVPLLVWIAVLGVLITLPLKVISYGFLPVDDALRHAAKVISGKDWQDILILRSGIEIDHNAGWHKLLGLVHNFTGWGTDGLVAFSVVLLCTIFLIAPLPFLSRPESWLATLMAALVAHPNMIYRVSLGRPYIFVMAATMAMLYMWMRHGERGPSRLTIITTILLISFCAWLHGGWYLYWLPAAGFFLAQRWRQGFIMTGCWLAGSFLGGVYTGKPIFFLTQQFQVLVSCFTHSTLQRILVGEFKSFDGAHAFVVATVLVLLVQAVRGRLSIRTIHNPAFMMAVLCWIFGFVVRRFWVDWGTPALLVWLALELQDMIEDTVPPQSLRRVMLTGLAAMGFFFAAGSDHESRWTANLTTEYLSPENKDLEGWLPGDDGIIYSDDTRIFYRTFFKNPTAPWRYQLGFEWTFMPEEDVAVYEKIWWNFQSYKGFGPWVKKLRPQDRMILYRPAGAPPAIPGLEWYYGATDTWIGRLPPGVTNAQTAVE